MVGNHKREENTRPRKAFNAFWPFDWIFPYFILSLLITSRANMPVQALRNTEVTTQTIKEVLLK